MTSFYGNSSLITGGNTLYVIVTGTSDNLTSEVTFQQLLDAIDDNNSVVLIWNKQANHQICYNFSGKMGNNLIFSNMVSYFDQEQEETYFVSSVITFSENQISYSGNSIKVK